MDRERLLVREDAEKAESQPRPQTLALATDTRLVAVVALAATVVARGLAPALPGSSFASGPLILGVDRVAAFLSQFAVIVGAATCVRLLLRAMIERRLSYAQRLISVVMSAAAIPIVLSAANRQIEPAWLLVLVGLSGGVALASLAPAMRSPQARAAALVLGVTTLATLVWAGARILALEASNVAYTSLFRAAEGIATLGLAFEGIACAITVFWLGRQKPWGTWLVASATLAAVAIVWAGVGEPNADAWRVVVARALGALTPQPDPLVADTLRYFVEVSAIVLAAAALASLRRPEVGPIVAFALLARASGDTPLGALMLMLAALSMALTSARMSTSQLESVRVTG